MHVSVQFLPAEEGVVFSRGYFVKREALGGAIASAVRSHGPEYAFLDVYLMGNAAAALLHVHKQGEVEAGIVVVLVLAKRRVVDAAHDGVVGGLSCEYAF